MDLISRTKIWKWIEKLHKNATKECRRKNFGRLTRADTARLIVQCIGIVFFLFFCFIFSSKISLLIPTYHVDGAFQTASGLFRLQNGEIPGRDFYPYLGILPLFLCYPLFLAAGGTVAASVFSAHFLVLVCDLLSLSIIHFFLSRNKKIMQSLCWGALLTTLLLLLHIHTPSFMSWLDIPKIILPGNSMRPVRQFSPYLCFFLLYLVLVHIKTKKAVYIGALTICIFSLWSNDYAYGTMFLAVLLGMCWFLTERTGKGIGNLLIFLLVFICGACCFMNIATMGNMDSLIRYNFIDVAKDQWWYFTPLSEYYRVYSLSSLWHILIISKDELILPFVSLLVILIDFTFFKSLGKLCLILIGCSLFAGGLTATIGGHASHYFYYFFFWGVGVLLFYIPYILSLVHFFRSFRKISAWIVPVLTFFITIYGCVFQTIEFQKIEKKLKRDKKFFYEASLGGYLSVDWQSYLSFWDKNKDKSFLEEYWGIASAYLHRNSDWKVDSVIHAFNNTRKESLEKILNKDYIITTNSSIMWSYWSLTQNYWFYEKVFHNYDFCFKVANRVYVWKRRKTPRVFQDAKVVMFNDNSFLIPSPGWYEVRLEYECVPKFHSLFVLPTPALDSHHQFSASIPSYQKEFILPVSCNQRRISVLSICNRGLFNLKSVHAKRIPDDIRALYDFYLNFYLSDGNWEKGYFRKSGGFFVKNSKDNRAKYTPGSFVLLPDQSRRKILRAVEKRKYLNVFTEGNSFVAERFPHELEIENWRWFYLSDLNWDRGYFRKSGGFFVKNSEDNRAKYTPGTFVVLPDQSRRKILRAVENWAYLNVFTEGNGFVTERCPHELEVKQ